MFALVIASFFVVEASFFSGGSTHIQERYTSKGINLCPTCVSFSEQAINQLLNIILSMSLLLILLTCRVFSILMKLWEIWCFNFYYECQWLHLLSAWFRGFLPFSSRKIILCRINNSHRQLCCLLAFQWLMVACCDIDLMWVARYLLVYQQYTICIWIYSDAGVVGGCREVCGLLANKTGSSTLGTVCTILCDIVGVREFANLIQKCVH